MKADQIIRWDAPAARNYIDGRPNKSCGVRVKDHTAAKCVRLHGVNSAGGQPFRLVIPKDMVDEVCRAMLRLVAGPLGQLVLDAEATTVGEGTHEDR